MRSHIWRYGVLVALLSFGASMMTLRNAFTQDDWPAIVEDERAHDPKEWVRYWSEPYWASKFGATSTGRCRRPRWLRSGPWEEGRRSPSR